MSPVIDYDGRPYSQRDLHKNMFEMDKFTVTLTKGQVRYTFTKTFLHGYLCFVIKTSRKLPIFPSII
jgi:hypothetical protein